jgi:hypothetical protein
MFKLGGASAAKDLNSLFCDDADDSFPFEKKYEALVIKGHV